jgi:hypothetical protein
MTNEEKVAKHFPISDGFNSSTPTSLAVGHNVNVTPVDKPIAGLILIRGDYT